MAAERASWGQAPGGRLEAAVQKRRSLPNAYRVPHICPPTTAAAQQESHCVVQTGLEPTLSLVAEDGHKFTAVLPCLPHTGITVCVLHLKDSPVTRCQWLLRQNLQCRRRGG